MRMARLCVAVGLGVWGLGCQWQLRAEADRDRLEELRPPPLVRPAPDLSKAPPRTFRLRVWAERAYRQNEPMWKERFGEVLGFVNQVTRSWYAVQFEVAEYREWAWSGRGQEIDELGALDRGEGVDWVVGLIPPVSREERRGKHFVGWAPYFGRHFVLRSTLYAEVVANLKHHLVVDPQQVYSVYGELLARENMVTFLHEWGHTLGAPHLATEGCFMQAGGEKRVRFCERTAQLVRLGLSRHDEVRGSARARARWLKDALWVVDRPDLEPVEREDLEPYRENLRELLARLADSAPAAPSP